MCVCVQCTCTSPLFCAIYVLLLFGTHRKDEETERWNDIKSLIHKIYFWMGVSVFIRIFWHYQEKTLKWREREEKKSHKCAYLIRCVPLIQPKFFHDIMTIVVVLLCVCFVFSWVIADCCCSWWWLRWHFLFFYGSSCFRLVPPSSPLFSYRFICTLLFSISVSMCYSHECLGNVCHTYVYVQFIHHLEDYIGHLFFRKRKRKRNSVQKAYFILNKIKRSF